MTRNFKSKNKFRGQQGINFNGLIGIGKQIKRAHLENNKDNIKATFFVWNKVVFALDHGVANNPPTTYEDFIEVAHKCDQYKKDDGMKAIIDQAIGYLSGKNTGLYLYAFNKDIWEYHLMANDLIKICERVFRKSNCLPEEMELVQFLSTRGDSWEPTKYFGTAFSPNKYRLAVAVCSMFKDVANCISLSSRARLEIPVDSVYPEGDPLSLLGLNQMKEKYLGSIRNGSPAFDSNIEVQRL